RATGIRPLAFWICRCPVVPWKEARRSPECWQSRQRCPPRSGDEGRLRAGERGLGVARFRPVYPFLRNLPSAAAVAQRCLRRRESRDRDAERRAGDVVEARLVEELDRAGVPAVLAADAHLQ